MNTIVTALYFRGLTFFFTKQILNQLLITVEVSNCCAICSLSSRLDLKFWALQEDIFTDAKVSNIFFKLRSL